MLSRMLRVAPLSRSFSSKTNIANINQKLVEAQYAVRGELVLKAADYQKVLATKGHKLPFDEVVFCNIGNPQELGQMPISFFRQVLALCVCPDLMNNAAVVNSFAPDAVARAKKYLASIPGGTGAYSTSQGVHIVREEVAKFIEARDGYPADPENIFLTDGASSGVKSGLSLLIRDHNDGILTPVPQYPLYSATIALQGGTLIPYLLDEGKGFATTADALRASLAAAKKKNPHLHPRAVVVINPGNPTGAIMTEKDMRDVVMFCKQEHLLLMADEVYQTNTWKADRPFISFKKVLRDLGAAAEGTELISFHSVSKGFVGECGRRGGYFELINIDPQVAAQIYKIASISLCSNVEGQLMVGLMCNPPKKGDASFGAYVSERDGILNSLQRRGQKLATAMSKLPGISCPPIDGALYLFPQITLPHKAIVAAKEANKQPDVFYCLELLAATGIVCVPGSGFGQAPGTFHFRTTILPAESKLDGVMKRFQDFHLQFMKKYQ